MNVEPSPIWAFSRRPVRSFQAWSVQRERSCDDLAHWLVRADHDTGGGDLTVDEGQSQGDGAFREQALAGPYDEREGPQAELVDQVVVHQGLNQVPAAVDLQLR